MSGSSLSVDRITRQSAQCGTVMANISFQQSNPLHSGTPTSKMMHQSHHFLSPHLFESGVVDNCATSAAKSSPCSSVVRSINIQPMLASSPNLPPARFVPASLAALTLLSPFSGGIQVLNAKRINSQNNLSSLLSGNGPNSNNILLSSLKPVSSSGGGGVGNLIIYSSTGKSGPAKPPSKPTVLNPSAEAECKPIIIYPKVSNGSVVSPSNPALDSPCLGSKRIKVESAERADSVADSNSLKPNLIKSLASGDSSVCVTSNSGTKKPAKCNIENCFPSPNNSRYFGNRLASSQLYHCDSLFFTNVSPHLPDDIFETDDEEDFSDDIHLEPCKEQSEPVAKANSPPQSAASASLAGGREGTASDPPCASVHPASQPKQDVSEAVVKCTSKSAKVTSGQNGAPLPKSKSSLKPATARSTPPKAQPVSGKQAVPVASQEDKSRLAETNQRKRRLIWRTLIKDIQQRKDRIILKSKERMRKRKLLASECQQWLESAHWSQQAKRAEAGTNATKSTSTQL